MRLLFIRFSAIGDALLTTGVLKKVHETFKDAEIEVLTSAQCAPVFEELPFVSRIHTIQRGIKLGSYLKLLKSMPEYDYIFDLHSNTRSFFAREILKGKAYKYKKDGFKRRMFVKLGLFKSSLNKHVAMRYAEAVFPPLKISIPNNLEELRPWLPKKSETVEKRVIIHPFASKFTKTWPYFPELAEKLKKAGYEIFVVGKGDFPADKAERISTPTLKELFEVISGAEIVISTDSGPLHAAVALNVPTVAVFGSTTKEFGFYPAFKNCAVVENNSITCRPCHVHGLPACPKGHFKCMKEISVKEVIKVFEEFKNA